MTPTELDYLPACPSIQCSFGMEVNISTCRCICSGNDGPFCGGIKHPPIWPTGSYALPASMYGCPEGDWDTRYINLTLPVSSNDMYWESSGTDYMVGSGNKVFHIPHSKDLYILGPYSKRSVQLNFCVQDGNDPSRLQEAQGNFCIYDIGKGCAKGFKGGNMTIRGYHSDMVGFGIHPENSTSVTFCCKEDSNITLLEVFPHNYPFVLLKGPSTERCEPMNDMTVIEDTMYMSRRGIYWDFHGTIPNLTISDTHVGITFCFYQPESYNYAFYPLGSQNSPWLSNSYSLGRPVYSSPYVKSPTNNPFFVVDEGKSNSIVRYMIDIIDI
ncbi:uncharacterized protein [Mytilus edulis]|uniref:uncharacterized protein n=1 Tax=Mytilus edulis TaxID=6550 RepID=UPI0039EEB314